MKSTKIEKINENKIKDKLHPLEIINKERSVKDILFILENDTPDVLLIIEEGKIIGIVTDSDIIMKVKKKDMYSTSIKIKDIMSSPVVFIESDKSMKKAIDKMIRNNIQKLIVTEKGTPIGILYGEDVFELDEKGWKEFLFNQTIDEVYKILLKEPEIDLSSIGRMVWEMDKFIGLKSRIEFEFYVYQEGLVLVTYYYIKENKNKHLEEIKTEIKKNYIGLLKEYSEREENKIE